MRLALILGLVHAFVDAATVTVVFRGTDLDAAASAGFALVLSYDLIAFGLQPVLGWLQDRWASPRIAMFVGLSLTLGGIGVVASGGSSFAVVLVGIVLAGLGNAAFHLGAGAQVLRQGLERSAPIGLMVAPGALGLAFGIWFGKDVSAGPVWLVALPVLLGLAVVARLRPGAGPVDAEPVSARAGHRPGQRVLGEPLLAAYGVDVAVGVAFLLMTSVAVRSLVGGSASRGYPAGAWLAVGIPLVACGGKALGGLLADRFGWVRTTVTALAVSAPILAFTYPHPVVLLVGLLAFQMTMPVTLVAIARLMPGHLATGFGLSCLALVLGSLPRVFPWGAELCSRPALGAWVLLSAVAAGAGLTSMGIAWRRPAPTSAIGGRALQAVVPSVEA